MEQSSVQQLFFQHIKNNLAPHLSLVDEIGEILGISNDSAYRRIRGEKEITFEEIQKISAHYRISLDQFLHLQSDSFLFSGKLTEHAIGYEQYLKVLHQNLSYLVGFEQKHLYFLSKDIPWMYYFEVPELSWFKSFLWMKSFLHYEELKGIKFSVKNVVFPEYIELGKKIINLYNQIPTTEIWNLEGINVTIQQIQYYAESNMFETDEDIRIILDRLLVLIDHIEKQAEIGKKFPIFDSVKPNSPDYKMFYNELAIGDNTVLIDLGKVKVTFLNHSVIDFLSTRDERFGNHMHQVMSSLIRKSTQISIVGEKNRSHFFNLLRQKIHRRKKMLNL